MSEAAAAAEKATSGGAAADEDDWGEDEVKEVEKMPLEVEIAPDTDISAEGGECQVMIRIQVPQGENYPEAGGPPKLERTKSGRVERAAMDVCCVVDISGSMSSRATYEVDGVQKDDGLTYLDIVKHAVKAVIHILKARDRFTLIAFDNKAEVAFALDHMTDDGRDKAVAALECLRPRGQTDIWHGILAGMDALRLPSADVGWRQKAILLLTDGCPNIKPPEGHIPALRGYKESHPDFNFQLNTFGFGYNLDSQLLLDLAVEGSGTFAFIPDAVIVGTCFVNSICNSLSTQTQNATLHLMAQGGAQFTGPVVGVGADLVTEASWGRVVSLGPLQFGQEREVIVPMNVPAGEAPYLQAVVVYPGKDGKECRAEGEGSSRKRTEGAKIASCRGMTVATGYEVLEFGAGPQADNAMTKLKSYMTGCFPGDDFVQNFSVLKSDVDGRMTKALDGKDRFNRWGKHYLRALTRAHQLQLCTNFMDPGLQVYGGMLFRGLRDEGDAVFCSLPAPKPTNTPSRPAPQQSSGYSGGQARPRSPSPDMNTYYAGSGGG